MSKRTHDNTVLVPESNVLEFLSVNLLGILLENDSSKFVNPDALVRQLEVLNRTKEAEFVRARIDHVDFYRNLVHSCFPHVAVVPAHVRDVYGDNTPLAWKATLRHLLAVLAALRVEFLVPTIAESSIVATNHFVPPLALKHSTRATTCSSFINTVHEHVRTFDIDSTTDFAMLAMLVFFDFSAAVSPLAYVDAVAEQNVIVASLHTATTVPTRDDIRTYNATVRVHELMDVTGARVYNETREMQAPFDEVLEFAVDVVWRSASRRHSLADKFKPDTTVSSVRAFGRARLVVRPWRMTSTFVHAIDIRQHSTRLSRVEMFLVHLHVDNRSFGTVFALDTIELLGKTRRWGGSKTITNINEYLHETRRYLVRALVPREWDDHGKKPLHWTTVTQRDTMLGEIIGPPRTTRPESVNDSDEVRTAVVVRFETEQR